MTQLAKFIRGVKVYAAAELFLSLLIILGLGISGLSMLSLTKIPLLRVVLWTGVISLLVGVLVLLWKGCSNFLRQGGAIGSLERAFPELHSDVGTLSQWHRENRHSRFSFSSTLFSTLETNLNGKLQALPFSEVFGPQGFCRRNYFTLWSAGCLLILIFVTAGKGNVIDQLRSNPREGLISEGKNLPPLSVGNIQVILSYPIYTGRPSNSFALGQRLEALRGSEADISFRVDRPMKQLGLLLPQGDFVLASADAGTYRVKIPIQESGPLRFRGVDQAHETRQDPLERELRVVPDEAPVIKMIEPSHDQSVNDQSQLPFRFEAQDDFGLSQINLRLEGEGFEREISISKPNHSPSGSGHFLLRISQLALDPRIRKLSALLVALDNDAISGAKEGRSQAITLLLEDREEERSKRIALFENWQKALVYILGNDLESPSTEKEIWNKQTEAFGKLLAEMERAPVFVTKQMKDLYTKRKEFSLGIQTSEETGRFWQKEIEGLERLILLLDRAMLQDQTERIGNVAKNIESKLQDLSARLSNNSGDLDQVLKELQEMLKALSQALSDFKQKGLAEQINPEAFEGKDFGSLQKELAEIARLLKEGKKEDARKRLAEYVKRMQQMAQNYKSDAEQTNRQANQKLKKQFDEALEKIQSLRKREQKLAAETSRLREKAKPAEIKELEKRQRSLQTELKTLREQVEELQQSLPQLGSDPVESVGRADQKMEEASKELEASRPEGALPPERGAVAALEDLEQQMQEGSQSLQRSEGSPMPGTPEVIGSLSYEPVLLPGPSDPEEAQKWRKALMDAMKDKPPQGFEEVNRQYFRELSK